MTNKDLITLTYQGHIAIITLNQASKLNALDRGLYYLLGERLREVEKREDVFITVLTGTGRFFSAGIDVNKFRSQPDDKPNRSEIVRDFVAGNFDITRTFYTHPKILVVALNGPVIGLSAALVAIADFIYAAPHAYLLTPFSSLGLVAEGGASHTFVERLGISKANEALIMSKPITCEELLATGFVNKVIASPSGRLDDSAGFLTLVLREVEDRLGPHLNQQSLLKIKELIRKPQREALDRQNGLEAFMGVERLMTGAPQIEFRKISRGEKMHKL